MAVFRALLLLSILKVVVGDAVDILTPAVRCVATATQIGNCHLCVCKTDGVFHCRGIKCIMNKNTTDPSIVECAPLHTYRLDTLLCTCDHSGNWRAARCKRRLYQMRPRTGHISIKIATNIACTPNHFYISECNICKCGHSGYINFESCTNRLCAVISKSDSCNPGDVIRTDRELCACSDINYFIDRLCLKVTDDPIQEIDAKALDSILDFGSFWDDFRVKCKPFYTYTVDCTHCFCGENGTIFNCEYKECERRLVDVLRVSKPIGKFDFKSLPELANLNGICNPGIKYRYKCNTCYCTREKVPICTHMMCLDQLQFTMHDLKLRQRKRDLSEMSTITKRV